MHRKIFIAGGALTLALAALLTAPTQGAAAQTAAEESAADTRPRRGFLGVGLQELTPELQAHFGAPEGRGVLVASVGKDSPAAAAGIQVGDVITAVDELAIDSTRELGREIRRRPGRAVAIDLVRDRQPLRITATLGERQARTWEQGGRSPEEWEELAERWQRWGEEFGQRWGEEFAERWGEEHAEHWQRWADELAERGEDWGEMGEEIGRTVEKALSRVDWEQLGRSVEESMKALESFDWEAMSEQIERSMEELELRLEQPPAPGGEAE